MTTKGSGCRKSIGLQEDNIARTISEGTRDTAMIMVKGRGAPYTLHRSSFQQCARQNAADR